jgi:hypothetical protein
MMIMWNLLDRCISRRVSVEQSMRHGMSDQAKPQTAALDEIFRLRAALEWIVANVDEKKAPLVVGRARMALRSENAPTQTL